MWLIITITALSLVGMFTYVAYARVLPQKHYDGEEVAIEHSSANETESLQLS